MDAKLRPFIKTINPEDLPAEAWNIVLGRRDESDLLQLYQQVSWLFRAVDIRCNGVASVPFAIYKGKEEIDTSGHWQNAVGFLPNPMALFGLIEMALTIWGTGYLYSRDNLLKTRPYSLRYLPPTTVQVKKQSGEYALDEQERPLFTRKEGGRQVDYSADNIVYFWKGDPFVEWGPPTSSPAKAAALSAGVVLDVNLFASAFLQRGAIKPLILLTKGAKKQTELDKLKDFMNRLFAKSRNKSYPTEVLNADELTPVFVGEGLEAISGKESLLSHSKREEIATALGIPHSVLFSGAANYSVSDKDDYHLYDKTIIPECRFIESVMNEQVFVPLGYRMAYQPETMDLFQEDEEQRAVAMNAFMDMLGKAETWEMAQAVMLIYGVEIPDEAMTLMESHFAKKDERREEFAANVSNLKPGGNGSKPPAEDDDDEKEELNKWLSKIRHRWNPKTKSAAEIGFEPENISPGLYGAIMGMLENCKSLGEVEAVFVSASEWAGYP